MFSFSRIGASMWGAIVVVALAGCAWSTTFAVAATVTPPTPPESVPAAATDSGAFASPFQIAPSQPLLSTSTSPGTVALPDAGNQCNLYAVAIANNGGTTTHRAWVSCTEEAPVQVEECPYVDVGGRYIRAGGCVTNPKEGTETTTYIQAEGTIDCSKGSEYKTWGWDYVPISSKPSTSGFSGAVTCK